MTSNFITITPDVQSGTPVFTGTRVPVKNLFDYIRGGDTIAEFLNDFPSVNIKQVEKLLVVLEKFITFDIYEENIA
ncbi:MAG: DUF433 domain-containing protein [Bacteroidales bacterium]|nr:DUF433 domain-containing protein [Bacteroidales bacterium]